MVVALPWLNISPSLLFKYRLKSFHNPHIEPILATNHLQLANLIIDLYQLERAAELQLIFSNNVYFVI
jgi:hypothetical protein